MANPKKYAGLDALQTFLDNIKTKFSQIGHKHTTADLTDYKVDTELSSTSSNPIANKTVDAEFDAIATGMNALEQAIDGKSDSTHNHDSAYAAKTHNHDGVYATATHNHDTKYDSKGSASVVQENLNTVSDKLDSHTTNSDIHVTTTNKTNWNTAYTHSQAAHARADATNVADSTTNGNILINGTETNVYSHPNSGVSAGTYKSVIVNAQGHITSGSNPTTLSGFGITDAETKTDAASKLTEAKTYADSAAAQVKNDLLNNAGAAYDTLKELGDLIDDNKDAIDALNDVAAGKANAVHTHAIADVSGLQSALDGKAASSHGTHVSFDSTNKPKMDGTAAFGTSSKVARADHVHPTDTSRASKTEFDSHTANTTAHITATERTNWNAAKTHADSAHAPSNAQPNQNAFSNIKVGTTTIAADTTTDTLELVGSNVTITPDATNDKVTIAVASGSTSAAGILKLTNSTSSTSTTTAATPSSVKSAYDLANTAKTNAATAQTRADNAYTLAESKVDSLSDLGITVTADELNYVDGVTSNIQTQLDGKAASSHTHSIANVTNLQSALDEKAASSYVKNNYITNTRIEDNLTSDASNYVLSAKQGKVLKGQIDNLSTTVSGKANSSHTHKVTDITDLTATATELNYMDGVTSNVQAQIDSKAASSHNHSASNITSGTMSVDRLPSASTSAKGVVQLDSSVTSTSTTTAATSKAVKLAYDLANSANTAIQNKANKSHSHEISEITNLQVDLDNRVSKKGDTMIGNLTVETTGSPAVRASSTSASITGELMVDSYGRVNISNKNRNNEGNRTTLMIGKYDSSDNYLLRICTYENDSVDKQYEVYHEGNPPTAEAIGAANVATMTTAEYTALEESDSINANTLYMLTDAEEEEEVFITTDDIDAICGATV